MKIFFVEDAGGFYLNLTPENLEDSLTLLRFTRAAKVEPPALVFDTRAGSLDMDVRKAKNTRFDATWIRGGRRAQ